MTDDDKLDEFGKRTLSTLRAAPPLDPQAANEVKAVYLAQAESLKQSLSSPSGVRSSGKDPAKRGFFWIFRAKPFVKFLVAGLIAVLILLVGSSITVSAAQDSLPGQALYPVKSWSEDASLALSFSPRARLNLILRYTNRRMDEISKLISNGQSVDEQTSERFQQELDDALQLAAELDDTQIQAALLQIRDYAESQGLTVEQLINRLPPQAEPAIQHLQDRLNEQVQLSSVGETDPKEFRRQVRERRQLQRENKHSEATEESELTSPTAAATPMTGQDENDIGNGKDQSTEVPGNGSPGNGQDGSQPGNGNHGQNPTHTPKP